MAAAGTLAPYAAAGREEVLDPLRPIVDPHHHAWDHPGSRYLFPELLSDLGSGHDIVQTMFVECGSMYRATGPVPMRVVGEVEFANGIAAMSASGQYGPCEVISGMVAAADLTLGEAIRPVLEAERDAAGQRLRGIRVSSTWDGAALNGFTSNTANRDLLASDGFRRGFALLAPMGLTFDAWCYHPQLGDVAALARAFPDTTIIVDHLGGPLRIGPYAGRDREVFAAWKAAILTLAKCPNVFMKLGGLGMPTFTRRDPSAPPPISAQLTAEWAPYIATAIESFGAGRCMFESNFPVDKATCDYRTLWNIFKTVSQGCSEDEKTALFSGTARRAYGLGAA
jgi:predicted TIM-barrel fold metal-dependent hydrolase